MEYSLFKRLRELPEKSEKRSRILELLGCELLSAVVRNLNDASPEKRAELESTIAAIMEDSTLE